MVEEKDREGSYGDGLWRGKERTVRWARPRSEGGEMRIERRENQRKGEGKLDEWESA